MNIKKNMPKLLSAAMSVMILCGGVGTAAFTAGAQSAGATQPAAVQTEKKDDAKKSGDAASKYNKKETVYVIADAHGKPEKVIVSNWIQNTEKAQKLADKTDLKDIEVLKGDNSYTIDEDHSCEWDAEGGDIYYKGTGSTALPVGVSLTYELDGKQVAPDDLAGKSGRLKIKIDYSNREYRKEKINGKEEKIYVPFVMLTGMMLDNEKAENISVSNGKVVNDGTHTFVVGFALPGMQETLQLDSDTLDIPSSVEITADVKEFELATTLTVATNDMFNSVDVDKLDSKYKELDEKLDKLVSATNELLDGSSQLYNGLSTLLDKSGELIDGVDRLYDGSKQIKDGTEGMKDGAAALGAGAAQLDGGVVRLKDGMSQVDDGAAALGEGAAQLDDGVAQLQGYLAQLSGGLNTISENSGLLTGGAKQVFDTFLSAANTQIAAAGLEAPELTVGNYDAVLTQLIDSLSDENARALAERTARETVTAAVESQRELIRQGVENAVRKQVTEAVLASAGYPMTAEEYDAAAAAGQLPETLQAQVSAAVGAQMPAMQNTIDAKTEEQIAAVIEQNMSSETVQTQIEEGVKKAGGGRQSLEALKTQLDSYNTFYNGILSYTAGVDQASGGARDILDGTTALKNGSGSLADGATRLADGTGTLRNGAAELKNGSGELSDGAKRLSDGAVQLDDGMGALFDGVTQLKNATPSLIEGITKLTDGSMQLSEGMKRYKEEGIDKLKEAADGDIKTLVERIKAISKVSKSYNNYSGISDGAEGKVDFIFKTAGIETKE